MTPQLTIRVLYILYVPPPAFMQHKPTQYAGMDHEIKKLTNEEDSLFVWDISYSYDYMSGCPSPRIRSLSVNDQTDSSEAILSCSLGQVSPEPLLVTLTPKLEANSIPLYPMRAGLPWHTSINALRQSKHWKSAVGVTEHLLNQVSKDEIAKIALQRRGISCADVAQAGLVRLNDGWVRFVAYMWPAANERRLELIASTLTSVFVFDDIWEMNEECTIRKLRDDFTSRSRVANEAGMKPQDVTPIQHFTKEILQGLEDEDRKGGDGGRELFERMVDFCEHPPPTKDFTSIREFLKYRVEDAGVPYVFAAVKFSLGSYVDIASPRIAHFLSLAGDQICYANDLGSYTKEKEAYLNGEVLYFINAVDTVQTVNSLPDSNSAKSATFALQIETELEMAAELQRLRASTDVTEDEIEFVEAVVHMCAGNMFPSVVMSRYGGETTRIRASI